MPGPDDPMGRWALGMFQSGWHKTRATAAAGATMAAGALLAAGLWTSPPALAAASILDQQIAVVTATHQSVIGAAQRALAVAQSERNAGQGRAGADQALVTQSAALTARSSAALAAAASARTSDTAARNAATAAIGADRNRLQAIGVELYIGPQITPIAGPDALAQAQQQEFGTEVVNIGTNTLIVDLHHRRSDERNASKAVAVDTRHVSDDQATLARATALRDNRAEVLARDQAALSLETTSVAVDQAILTAENAALTKAVAALANPPGAPDDGTPSIVGVAALDAAQLAGWYHVEGWADFTPAPVEALAGWYLSEGAAEGVRGDVAFAQAMVETAGFSSNDAVAFNNYAGVGHCDSCGSGLAFGSPQLGVRGQIQLLHSFADAGLTAAALGRPLAVASLTPQTQPDRGCCATWQSLTGKWATDPLYGHTIMGVYQRMLGYALAHP